MTDDRLGLYLRLFYTEQFLGWNAEEWPAYVVYSSLVTTLVAGALLAAQRSPLLVRQYVSSTTVLLVCGVYTPLLIGLFFAAGRVTMLPPARGVHDMPRFGCCSQGFVIPQSRIPDLVSWYESWRIGYVDQLTEQYANERGELRWALTPCVLQHVGQKSSKSGRNAGRLWNFAFERNDADALQREHDLVKSSDDDAS